MWKSQNSVNILDNLILRSAFDDDEAMRQAIASSLEVADEEEALRQAIALSLDHESELEPLDHDKLEPLDSYHSFKNKLEPLGDEKGTYVGTYMEHFKRLHDSTNDGGIYKLITNEELLNYEHILKIPVWIRDVGKFVEDKNNILKVMISQLFHGEQTEAYKSLILWLKKIENDTGENIRITVSGLDESVKEGMLVSNNGVRNISGNICHVDDTEYGMFMSQRILINYSHVSGILSSLLGNPGGESDMFDIWEWHTALKDSSFKREELWVKSVRILEKLENYLQKPLAVGTKRKR